MQIARQRDCRADYGAYTRTPTVINSENASRSCSIVSALLGMSARRPDGRNRLDALLERLLARLPLACPAHLDRRGARPARCGDSTSMLLRRALFDYPGRSHCPAARYGSTRWRAEGFFTSSTPATICVGIPVSRSKSGAIGALFSDNIDSSVDHLRSFATAGTYRYSRAVHLDH